MRLLISLLDGTDFKLCWIGQSQRRTNHVTVIDLIPDELLLDIFDYIVVHDVTNWQVLTQVCRRWRQIVFASPRRLDLQLFCTNGTSVKEYLACWPAFPIVVRYECGGFRGDPTPNVEDNVVAALDSEHHSRISHIWLSVPSSLWSKLTTVMQEPFPALTSLLVIRDDGNVPSIPSGFLGGSAPCLRKIWFDGIPMPALPNLLSHKSNLVELEISDFDTPRADFISPAALVACLAVLPRLKALTVSLPTWTSQDDHWKIDPPPKTGVALPALTSFAFLSERTYLEEFVAQIETPRLEWIDITFQEFLDSQIPQLTEFINRSGLKPSSFEDAKICFDDHDMVFIDLNYELDHIPFSIHISSWEETNHKVWCMVQALRQISGILSNVGHLEIDTERRWPIEDEDDDDEDEYEDEDMGDADWLGLLRPFTAVETLYVCEKYGKSVARALEGMPAEIGNQVLPALKELVLEGEPTTSTDYLFLSLQGRDRPVTITIERSQYETH